ncbi:MAG: aminotransferase class V-fold PLP-dependent enzyme [Anaerolineae bacterium]
MSGQLYQRLGVRRVINACGNLTPLGGSLMDSRVLEAMADASCWFVDLNDLLKKAGQRIADLVGVEAAFITSGAAAGLVLSTAACMAGRDRAKAARLPDTTGMKNQVIVHRCQRNVWDQAVRQAGAMLVEIGLSHWTQPWELEAAIGQATAAILYFTNHSEEQSLPLEEVIRIAKAHGLPVIVDAAAELPPKENLHRFNDMGADLVVFSGGKMLRGPQCTGLILGRRDLIETCAFHASPNFGIGRPMKVGKEEIAGLVRAVELFLEHDFDADLERWEQQVGYCLERLCDLDGVKCKRVFPGEDPVLPRGVPRVYLTWDESLLGIAPAQVRAELLSGEPSIAVGTIQHGISINPITLAAGEEEVVARRVAEVLKRVSP